MDELCAVSSIYLCVALTMGTFDSETSFRGRKTLLRITRMDSSSLVRDRTKLTRSYTSSRPTGWCLEMLHSSEQTVQYIRRASAAIAFCRCQERKPARHASLIGSRTP